MVEFDREFCISWPYGVLKTLQVLTSLATLITIYLGPYKYASIGFVQFIAWAAFFTHLLYLIFYLLGVQRKSLHSNDRGSTFIALVLGDFLLSVVAAALYFVSALICLICIFTSIEHRIGVLITYLFAFIFTAIAFISFSYYAILIYRAIPNGRWSYLQYLIVNGKEISVHPASGIPNPSGFTSVSMPSSHQHRTNGFVA